MFRCEGLVGKPASQMFVEANISGLFQEYHFPTIPSENNATEIQCNTRQLYQFYDTFNMSWNGSAIRCAVKNARTNEIMRSSLHILKVISENYCVGKGNNLYPHPYECQKFIRCEASQVYAVFACGSNQCFGVNEIIAGGCTFCNDPNLICYPGAHM
ncbi:hypothetical protein CHS0354_041821 [Potamilus streckersoni]|uniref:Chitin-binding type-2 domain-containing protein n=1 Tax=Potamilus streckersoni TaxID=2493646 RepID=A0AAE0T147_9BIVA|nr:hypothetical protein CHS0354_041821 [Potamilus streckersoni]